MTFHDFLTRITASAHHLPLSLMTTMPGFFLSCLLLCLCFKEVSIWVGASKVYVLYYDEHVLLNSFLKSVYLPHC